MYYLDGLDFGVHIAGSGVPRAVSWRGDMIQIYSELDRKDGKGFGRRRMRKDLAGCYLNVHTHLLCLIFYLFHFCQYDFSTTNLFFL